MLYYIGMKNDIDNIEYASLLYDFYGKLLDDGKREIMRLYHDENLSLSEISHEMGLTRQAVHYNLKKAESELSKYDNSLDLISTYLNNVKRLDIINKYIKYILSNEDISNSSRDKLHTILSIVDEMAE